MSVMVVIVVSGKLCLVLPPLVPSLGRSRCSFFLGLCLPYTPPTANCDDVTCIIEVDDMNLPGARSLGVFSRRLIVMFLCRASPVASSFRAYTASGFGSAPSPGMLPSPRVWYLPSVCYIWILTLLGPAILQSLLLPLLVDSAASSLGPPLSCAPVVAPFRGLHQVPLLGPPKCSGLSRPAEDSTSGPARKNMPRAMRELLPPPPDFAIFFPFDLFLQRLQPPRFHFCHDWLPALRLAASPSLQIPPARRRPGTHRLMKAPWAASPGKTLRYGQL
ncbi:uncharacterized protein LOC102564763 isoform X1 [Alligator mississippiensis]|uniref:uncharacterized protein LOC102564763 isoform X1 n=1 Tax=Alligator mississippiensis TaxID=8496 RepID=UPI002877BB43|nr:uncharacterized protein LOC102564763 isoform X1 [Alligator mississippiensis]